MQQPNFSDCCIVLRPPPITGRGVLHTIIRSSPEINSKTKPAGQNQKTGNKRLKRRGTDSNTQKPWIPGTHGNTHADTSDAENIHLFVYLHPNSFEMAKKFTYKTQGTCSKSIEIELEGDIVKSVRFEGGCHGNTQGIGLLTRGMQAADVIARLEGIDCKGRGTSCPDQLAKALASGPRTITATTKPENGPVLQNPGKQRKNKSSYTVSRTAPGNGAADVCRSPGPIVVTGD